MRLDEVYAALALPEPTRLQKRVFKKLFHERGALRPTDSRVLSDAVGTITWAFTLKPSTLPVRPLHNEEREYVELAVLDVEVLDRRAAPRVAELVHRAIPYPVLLAAWDTEGVSLSAAHKRLQRGARVVPETIDATPWLDGDARDPVEVAFLQSLPVSGLPQQDLFTLYDAWIQRILGLSCAALSGQFDPAADRPPPARRAALDACVALDRELRALRAAIRAEPSFARRVDLHNKIKSLEAALRRQTTTL